MSDVHTVSTASPKVVFVSTLDNNSLIYKVPACRGTLVVLFQQWQTCARLLRDYILGFISPECPAEITYIQFLSARYLNN